MSKRRCFGVLGPGIVAMAFLLTAPAAGAVNAPGLASSAQYKAFVEYVKKMEERSSQPTSATTKNTYEAKLTAKEQVERVRAKEGEALEALGAETASKLERLEASYHVKFEHIVVGHRNREKALKGQIAELRAKKAATGKGKAQVEKKKEAKEGEIGAAADETVKKIDAHWSKAFEAKKAALNTTRENRLGYLEQKLEQGRAAIAAMPSTG